jgi:hypothetical protein
LKRCRPEQLTRNILQNITPQLGRLLKRHGPCPQTITPTSQLLNFQGWELRRRYACLSSKQRCVTHTACCLSEHLHEQHHMCINHDTFWYCSSNAAAISDRVLCQLVSSVPLPTLGHGTSGTGDATKCMHTLCSQSAPPANMVCCTNAHTMQRNCSATGSSLEASTRLELYVSVHIPCATASSGTITL